MSRDSKTKRKVDVSDRDLSGYPSELKDLTGDEIDQLANIGTTTISTVQWGIVGRSDQDVRTISTVTFNNLTLSTLVKLLEQSADPAEPGEGEAIIWMGDGTGYGADGDVLIASKVAGATKKAILFVHAGGAGW